MPPGRNAPVGHARGGKSGAKRIRRARLSEAVLTPATGGNGVSRTEVIALFGRPG